MCGAAGDGRSSDTSALQLAIDRVAARGGGTVRLPPGRYVSGTLLLRSGVTFEVERGATLLGSTSFGEYRGPSDSGAELPPSPYTQDEARFRGLLVAVDAHDVAVTGGGTIDGRGATLADNIHRLQAEGHLPGNAAARPDESLRPCLINFVRCSHVRVADVTLRDSACWVENYTACDDLTVDHVTVRSQANWNNDGIDVSGCRHVRVAHCDIDSADDGICLKSNGSDCEDVDVHDCRVRSWANAIKFGTVSFGGFRHVAIRHVQVWGSGHAGLSIESVDGAVIDDLTVSDVAMTNLRQAILIKLGSRHTPGGHVGAI
jgi:polygalacturonase